MHLCSLVCDSFPLIRVLNFEPLSALPTSFNPLTTVRNCFSRTELYILLPPCLLNELCNHFKSGSPRVLHRHIPRYTYSKYGNPFMRLDLLTLNRSAPCSLQKIDRSSLVICQTNYQEQSRIRKRIFR